MSRTDTRTTDKDMSADRYLRYKGVRVRVRWYENLCHDLRAMYRGVLTPTGKDKKLPWFFVGWCSRCELVKFSSSRLALASRFRCHGVIAPQDGVCGAELR